MAQILGLDVELLVHDCIKVKSGGSTIYFDPFRLEKKDYEKADIVFVSHEHFDHCSSGDIRKVATEDTVIVASRQCKAELSKLRVREVRYLAPGDSTELDGIMVEAVPAYNVNKFRSPGEPFHPQKDGKNGYVVTIDGRRLYHAGDTDFTPEMGDLRKIDIAFLPVSGTYVMTSGEAAEAVKAFSPKVAVPMHYGAIVGSDQEAKSFEKLAKGSCEVKVLL